MPRRTTCGYKNHLNNYCQSAWGAPPQYVDAFRGPQHAGTWISFVYIDGVEYGRGEDTFQLGAQEKAALCALRILRVM
ncbi:hypothetical protein L218DRAFT_967489 [Marasmius fiardii PR-910]|nr:hypothetical protein L218DRAFT_967489 [Marasmius fiardii PR-910]